MHFCICTPIISLAVVLINPFFVLSQFDEQKDQVAVEQILRVVFLDPERASPVSSPFSDSD